MTSTTEQYVTFVLGEEMYAAPVANIREIVRATKVTRVPLAPDHVEGVMNLRGEVLPIINLRKMLNLPAQEIESSKIVVLVHEGHTLGMIVDRTSQVIRSSKEEQQDSTTQSDFVTKVIRTNSGLCLMFDIEKLFQTQSQNHETKGISTVQDQAKEHIVTKRENYIQLVTFELSGGIYAFKIDDVQEIIRYVEPTKIPGVPEYVRGLAELREKVLPIIDLRELLELPSTQIDEFTKVIVLKINNTLVGVVVDRIREVLRIEESKMLPPPTISQEGYSQELLGIVHIDEQMTMVLDHKTLLADKIQSLVETQQHIEEIEDRTITEEEKQYVIFKVGGEEYGVHIEEIREINRLTTLTKVPRAPDYLVGLMNLRGEILPVIDLRKRFGLPIDEKNDLMVRAIVTESSGKKTAFIVDSVVGVQRISIKSIADIPEAFTFGESARFVSKIARIDDRVILLLQMDKILTEQEQKVIQKTVENSDISKVDKKKNLKRR